MLNEPATPAQPESAEAPSRPRACNCYVLLPGVQNENPATDDRIGQSPLFNAKEAI